MKKQEFLDKLDNIGFNFDNTKYHFGEPTDDSPIGDDYIEEDTNRWKVEEVGIPGPTNYFEAHMPYVTLKGTEDEIFNNIYSKIINGYIFHYQNSDEIKDIIEMPKNTLCKILSEKYYLADSTIDLLLKTGFNYFLFLIELKYFIKNKKFVYVQDACWTSDDKADTYTEYSVQDFHEKLNLSPIDSFIYFAKVDKGLNKHSVQYDIAQLSPEDKFYCKAMSYGIDVSEFHIATGYLTHDMYYSGVYYNSKQWVKYDIGDRNEVYTLGEYNTAEEAYNALWDTLMGKMWERGYINISIDSNIIQTSKDEVVKWLSKHGTSYGYAEAIWYEIKQNFGLLNELKYYIKKGKFVRNSDAYKRDGLSVKTIYDTSEYSIASSFLHWLYMGQKNKYLFSKSSFFKKCNDCGVDLNDFDIHIGLSPKKIQKDHTYMFPDKNNMWHVIYIDKNTNIDEVINIVNGKSLDKKSHDFELFIGLEQEAFGFLWSYIITILKNMNSINQDIDVEVFEAPKKRIIDELTSKKFNYSKNQAEHIWSTLKNNIYLLNELKYAAVIVYDDKLVSDDCAYKYKGSYGAQNYSARDIHQITGLNAVDSLLVLYMLAGRKNVTPEQIKYYAGLSPMKTLDKTLTQLDIQNHSAKAKVLNYYQAINDALDYEEVFGKKISLDDFCKYYGLDNLKQGAIENECN